MAAAAVASASRRAMAAPAMSSRVRTASRASSGSCVKVAWVMMCSMMKAGSISSSPPPPTRARAVVLMNAGDAYATTKTQTIGAGLVETMDMYIKCASSHATGASIVVTQSSVTANSYTTLTHTVMAVASTLAGSITVTTHDDAALPTNDPGILVNTAQQLKITLGYASIGVTTVSMSMSSTDGGCTFCETSEGTYAATKTKAIANGQTSTTDMYVQQLFTLKIKLHFLVELKSGNLSKPLLANAKIEKIGTDEKQSLIVNGRRYQVIEQNYAITPQESGELCLMSCILGNNRDIFFPKLNEELHLITFPDIAVKYLEIKGYKPHLCNSENEARELIKTLPEQGKWPCLFTESNTTGEKKFEEFYTYDEVLDQDRFEKLGIIKNEIQYNEYKLNDFESNINQLKSSMNWNKKSIVNEFFKLMPNFNYNDNGKYLDRKM